MQIEQSMVCGWKEERKAGRGRQEGRKAGRKAGKKAGTDSEWMRQQTLQFFPSKLRTANSAPQTPHRQLKKMTMPESVPKQTWLLRFVIQAAKRAR
jgi:hypothetical protein